MDVDIDLSILEAEPSDEYHARAAEYLSSHQLLDFLHCPRLYRDKQLGLVDDEHTEALAVGTAAHVRILEGRAAFEEQFAVGGPVNKTSGKPYHRNTKAFRTWAAAQGKPGIHPDDLALIENLASGVAMNDEAVELLLYGRAEGVVRTEYCGTPCQCRFDWIHPHQGLVEFKTTADLDWFECDGRRRRYHHQVAFYQALLAEAIGEYVPVHIIAVEKKPPYRCGTWRVSDEVLGRARRRNEDAIRRLQHAWRTDQWPTGYEEIRLWDFP